MSKLSKAQRKVLEALAKDPENRWIRTDRHISPFLAGAGARDMRLKAHTNTLIALRKRGYIELFERGKAAPRWARDYSITEAGIGVVTGD